MPYRSWFKHDEVRLLRKPFVVPALLLAVVFLLVASLATPSLASAAAGDASLRQSDCGGTTNGNPDADCDGTPDSIDQCPTTPGVAGSGAGCPYTPPPYTPPSADPSQPSFADQDGDGTPDQYDACPNAAGQVNGCPDSDGDGIVDSKDACPDIRPVAGRTADGCPDADNDGVADKDDKCTYRLDGHARAAGASAPKVDASGCPPYSASTNVDVQTTKDIADGPGLYVACSNTKGVQCTFELTLTLDKASARALGLPARLMSVTLKTKKKSSGGTLLYFGDDVEFSGKVQKAFDRAYARRIRVTMTLAGTYRLGSGKERTLGSRAYTITSKDPSGAYRFSMALSAGPDGPDKPKKPSDDDF